MKRVVIATATFIVITVIGILFVGRTFYPDNVAETSVDGGEKNLKTRFYRSNVKTVTKEVEKLIPTITTYGLNWKLTGKSGAGNVSTVRAEVPVAVFTDDLEVTVKKAENEHEVRVDVRSQSRIGQSDFGENARHVRKFLVTLDQQLKSNR